MITNWKTLAAGGLGLLASAIWVPKMFGGGSGKIDPASEPPPEYWESGATEPWTGETFDAESGEAAPAPLPVVSVPGTPAGEAPVEVPASSGPGSDSVDADRLLSLAETIRGGSLEVETPRAPLASELELELGRSSEPLGERIAAYQQDLHVSATMVGDDSSALVEGQLVQVGDYLDGTVCEVVGIRSRSVTCRLDGIDFEIRMPAFRTREANSNGGFIDDVPGDVPADQEP